MERVLIVEEELAIRALFREFFEQKGYQVLEANCCREAEQLWSAEQLEVAILDYNLRDGNALDLIPKLKGLGPDVLILILTGDPSLQLAVDAAKLGAEQVLIKPVDLATLLPLVNRSLESRRGRQGQLPQRTQNQTRALNPFIGNSQGIVELAKMSQKVLRTDSPMLIEGETGTGKGVLAHWLHQNGPRRLAPFVDLNCGSLSRDLLETELFGHERGAFTGAVQVKVGLLEVAHKGTVFLDEIGDADLQVQPKLLKVLEEKQFRRLGEVRDRNVDVHLVAATHYNMAARVREGLFRGDLYFRINTIRLRIPPLRERVEDIPLLVANITAQLAIDMRTGAIEVDAGAMRGLQAYSWPGNIRELHNVLERGVLLSGSRVFTERDLHFDPEQFSSAPQNKTAKTLEEVKRDYIEKVLRLEDGNVIRAALKLGVPRSSLYYKIKQYQK